MKIIPEGIQDELYLEEVLGLRKNNDQTTAQRSQGHAAQEWGTLILQKAPQPASTEVQVASEPQTESHSPNSATTPS